MGILNPLEKKQKKIKSNKIFIPLNNKMIYLKLAPVNPLQLQK